MDGRRKSNRTVEVCPLKIYGFRHVMSVADLQFTQKRGAVKKRKTKRRGREPEEVHRIIFPLTRAVTSACFQYKYPARAGSQKITKILLPVSIFDPPLLGFLGLLSGFSSFLFRRSWNRLFLKGSFVGLVGAASPGPVFRLLVFITTPWLEFPEPRASFPCDCPSALNLALNGLLRRAAQLRPGDGMISLNTSFRLALLQRVVTLLDKRIGLTSTPC